MKLIINLGLVLLVLMAVLVTLPVKDGKPLFSVDELKAILTGEAKPNFDAPNMDFDVDMGGGSGGGGNAYRWQDRDGNWHFSDRKPDSTAEEITLKHAQTVGSGVAASADGIEATEDGVVVQEVEVEDDLVVPTGEGK